MNRTFGLVMMTGFWLASVISALALIWFEVGGFKPQEDKEYQYLTSHPGDLNSLTQAHTEWFQVTLWIGMTLVLAGIAYLMYVKFVQEPSDQEKTVLGIKA